MVTVSRMTEADIEGAIDCIQLAFADDPYSKWVFNDRSDFALARNRLSLGIRCRWGLDHALFYVAKDTDSTTSNRVLGVACWMAPTNPFGPQSWYDWYGDWKLWFEQVKMNLVYRRAGLNLRRYRIWKAAQAEAQTELWTNAEGYYFCNIVTVLPEAQGRGIGKELFGVVMRRADEEGKECYLESSRAVPNMAIYEKMGFRLAKDMLCDDDGDAITLYCMKRMPLPLPG